MATVAPAAPTLPEFASVGVLSRYFDVPPHRVTHAIESRKIEPAMTVSRMRLFDARGVELIRQALVENARSHRPIL